MAVFGVGVLIAAVGAVALLLCVRRSRPAMTMAFGAMLVLAGAAVSLRTEGGFYLVGAGLLLGLLALSRDADQGAWQHQPVETAVPRP